MARGNSSRSRNGLTARQCTTLPPGKYNDGNGLWLAVSESGARKWFLRVTVAGKRREMGLGGLRDVTLLEARRRAAQARSEAVQGVDPIEARRHKVESTVPNFTQAAGRYIRAHRRRWRNPKHAHQWVSTLKTYAQPVIRSKAVDEIGTEDVLKILSPIWTTRTETAKRVQGCIENVLDFAAARSVAHFSRYLKWVRPISGARMGDTPVLIDQRAKLLGEGRFQRLRALVERIHGAQQVLGIELAAMPAQDTSEGIGQTKLVPQGVQQPGVPHGHRQCEGDRSGTDSRICSNASRTSPWSASRALPNRTSTDCNGGLPLCSVVMAFRSFRSGLTLTINLMP